MYNREYLNLPSFIIITFLAGTTLMYGDYFSCNNILYRNYIYIILAFVITIYLLFKSNYLINISYVSAGITLFLFYILLWNIKPYNIRTLYLFSSIILLQSLLNININEDKTTKILIPFCYILVLICLMQCLNIFPRKHQTLITGTFDNPSGVSLFLTSCTPFLYSTFLKHKEHYKLILIILVWAIVITIGSRAGIISLSIISLLFLLKKKIIRITRRNLIIGLLCTLPIIILLLFAKSESTYGRFLIYKLTLSLAFEDVFWGKGIYGFTANYMNKQEEFFRNNPDSIFCNFAGITLHPLNEYLLFFVQYGLVGLALLLMIIFNLKRIFNMNVFTYYLCIINIAIQSCFTYSLRYSFIWFFIILCLSQIIKGTIKEYNFILSSYLRIICLIILSFFSHLFYKDISFEYYCGSLLKNTYTKTYAFRNIEEYPKLLKAWNGNPFFFYNYSVALRADQQYKESNKIINLYNIYISDYHGILLQAKNYFSSKQYELALKYYHKAYYMCPNRFIPLQGIMKSNHELGDIKAAIKSAYLIMNKKEKIKSYNTALIKKEADNYLKLYDNENYL